MNYLQVASIICVMICLAVFFGCHNKSQCSASLQCSDMNQLLYWDENGVTYEDLQNAADRVKGSDNFRYIAYLVLRVNQDRVEELGSERINMRMAAPVALILDRINADDIAYLHGLVVYWLDSPVRFRYSTQQNLQGGAVRKTDLESVSLGEYAVSCLQRCTGLEYGANRELWIEHFNQADSTPKRNTK